MIGLQIEKSTHKSGAVTNNLGAVDDLYLVPENRASS